MRVLSQLVLLASVNMISMEKLLNFVKVNTKWECWREITLREKNSFSYSSWLFKTIGEQSIHVCIVSESIFLFVLESREWKDSFILIIGII